MRTSLLCSIAFTLTVASATPPPAMADGKLSSLRILLVGDSTMAVRTGYGPGFCQAVVAQVQCLDMAKGGRSTKSYREEGSWKEVEAVLQDKSRYSVSYVLIQFGHNDQPNKPGRSTDLKTEFPANLRRFVDDVRERGAKPILVTPLTRRMFIACKLSDTLGPWADETRAVAKEKSVPLLDLYAESSKIIGQLGPVEANAFAMAPPPPAYAESAKTGTSKPLSPKEPKAPGAEPQGDPGPVFDYTHLGAKGASYFGRMVAVELGNAVPDLKPYIKQQ
jgi:lysophospholipase L1-like esterase